MAIALAWGQVLLTFVCQGEGPVRFGFPLPARVLARGLSVSGSKTRLQWRPLQERPDPHTGRQWVELAVTGGHGRVSLRAGGHGPSDPDEGEVVSVESVVEIAPDRETRRTRWHWCTGEVDERVTVTFLEPVEHEDEWFDAGESLTTDSANLLARALRVRVSARQWVRAGVLPRPMHVGGPYRARLVEAAGWLRQLPGRRGHGDYGRSHDVITNLEFDTTLAFVKLGLAAEHDGLRRRAAESARHLIDRDLEPRTGLPFRHGKRHRGTRPEVGHVWLSGLLLTGCVFADEELIRHARSLANGLARHPPSGQGKDELARTYGWPLGELETWLRFADDPAPRRAADRLADEVRRRWDSRNRVIRFGEGERRGGAYEERAWLTGGILVPALRRHLLRRSDPALRRIVESTQRRLLDLVLEGKPGLPVRYWVKGGEVRGQVRLQRVPEAFMLLEGLAPRALARCLKRKAVARALADVPPEDDPDLATSFSIAARCGWVLR